MTPEEVAGRITLSVLETASLLGVDPRTVRKAIDAGELPGIRYAGRVLVLAAPLRHQLGLAQQDGESPCRG